MKYISSFIFFLLISPKIYAFDDSYRPQEGYVPNERVAKIIAEAVLVPIYGYAEINRQKPFKVVLREHTWIVQGTTPGDRGVKYFLGGRFTLHVSRKTGEITHLSHSR